MTHAFKSALREQWRKFRWIAVLMPLALPVAIWFNPPPLDYPTPRLVLVCVGMMAAVALQLGLTVVLFALIEMAFARFWPDLASDDQGRKNT